MFLFLFGAFTIINTVYSTCIDLTRVPETYGTDVVLACVRLIQNVGQFEDDHGLLRKIAFVETEDGESAFTYAPDRGGIWGVSKEAFEATKFAPSPLTSSILNHFLIDWSSVVWDDLRKPLHSALAARLHLHLSNNDGEPLSSTDNQLKLWKLLTGQPRRTDSYFINTSPISVSDINYSPNASSINTETVAFGSYFTRRNIISYSSYYLEIDIDDADEFVEIELSLSNFSISGSHEVSLYVSNVIASSPVLNCGMFVARGVNRNHILLRPSEFFQYGTSNKLFVNFETTDIVTVDVVARIPPSPGGVPFESTAESFVIGMFSNHPDAGALPITVLIDTVDTLPVDISIEDINGPIMSFTMTSATTTVELPSTYVVSDINDKENGILVKAKAGKKINIFVTNYYSYSSDSYQALPLQFDYAGVYEYTYYAITPNTNTTGLKNRLLLIGNFDLTTVSIFVTRAIVIDGRTYLAGEEARITINSLETLLIESDSPLTGMKVVTTRSITFLSGHQCAVIPDMSGNSCDFAIEQFPPTITWGKTFIFQMLASRTGGSHFTVLSSGSNNNVSLWCKLTSTDQTLEHNFTLESEGSFKTLEIAPDDVICSMVTTEPSILTVLGTSENNDENLGDPLLIHLPPVEQFVNTSTYGRHDSLNRTYINLMVTGNYLDVLMDGTPMSAYTWNEVYVPSVGDADSYSGFVTQFLVDNYDSHIFTTANGEANFSVFIYGFDFSIGYGQKVGMMLKPINHPFQANALSPVIDVRGSNIASSQLGLECETNGLPAYAFVWEKSGSGILQSNNKYFITSDPYISLLSIAEVNPSDSGLYTCTFYTYYNGFHSLSAEYSLVAQTTPLITYPVPAITTSQQEYGAQENQSILIEATAVDANDVIISWQFEDSNGFIIDLDNNTNPSKYILSNNYLSIQIMDLQLGEHGNISIATRTDGGTAIVKVKLTVFVEVALYQPGGSSFSIDVGTNLTLNCHADGINSPVFIWRHIDRALLDSDNYVIKTTELSTGLRNISGIKGSMSSLTITDITERDEGQYICIANNVVDIPQRHEFTVSVNDIVMIDYCSPDPCNGNGVCANLSTTYECICNEDYTGTNCQTEIRLFIAPQIITPPDNIKVDLYDFARLVCVSSGVPSPSVKWFKDELEIMNSRQSELIFESIDLNDRGIYYCEVSNIDKDGNKYVKASEKVIVNIQNIAQYRGYISMDSMNMSDTVASMVITEVNDDMIGIVMNGNTYILLQMQPNESPFISNDNYLVPILLTVLIQDGNDVNELINGISQQILKISQQLLLTQAVFLLDVSDRFDGCQSNVTILPSPSNNNNLSITIEWIEADIGEMVYTLCPCGEVAAENNLIASRYCSGDFITGGVWAEADTTACEFSDLARELCQLSQLEVGPRLNRLEELTTNIQDLGTTEVIISVSILVNTTDFVLQNDSLIQEFLNVVDNLFNVNQSTFQDTVTISNTSARIQEAVLLIADGLPILNDTDYTILLRSTFAVAITQSELGFSINDIPSNDGYNVQYNRLEDNNVTTASIVLPSNLFDEKGLKKSKISNAAFLNLNAFLVRDIGYREVGSVVISAQVVGYGSRSIKNLTSPVTLSFQIQNTSDNARDPQCVFFDTLSDDGYGQWSSEGCQIVGTVTDNIINCQCDHLTSFAILLDVSPDAGNNDSNSSHPLTAISYIGLCVSIVCLIITIISYLSSKKLRNLETGQLLVNLCIALLGLYSTFIAAIHSRFNIGLCSFVAAALHYFFLVTFMTMAVEAISLYINLIIVLGNTIHRFVIKGVIVSWIVPFFIVLFSFGPNYKNYVRDQFCRAYGVPYYAGMIAPFLVIYIFNWIIFSMTFVSLAKSAFQRRKTDDKANQSIHTFVRKQFIRAIILSTLLGVGWGIGLLATEAIYKDTRIVRDIIAAVFILVTAFHGVLIFIMHCLRSKEVLLLWKQWFYGIARKDVTSTTTGTFDLSSKKRVVKEKKFNKNHHKVDDVQSIMNSSYESSSLKYSKGGQDSVSTLQRQVTDYQKKETGFSNIYEEPNDIKEIAITLQDDSRPDRQTYT